MMAKAKKFFFDPTAAASAAADAEDDDDDRSNWLDINSSNKNDDDHHHERNEDREIQEQLRTPLLLEDHQSACEEDISRAATILRVETKETTKLMSMENNNDLSFATVPGEPSPMTAETATTMTNEKNLNLPGSIMDAALNFLTSSDLSSPPSPQEFFQQQQCRVSLNGNGSSSSPEANLAGDSRSGDAPDHAQLDHHHQHHHWYSNPLQLTAMISNFSTSYNAVNISLVVPILQVLYPDTNDEDKAAVASSLLAGMIVGQLLGGALGDSPWLGRLGALRLVVSLQILASLGSATSLSNEAKLFWELSLWRFLLGIGAGGVYPLAAVLSAEANDDETENRDDDDENVNVNENHSNTQVQEEQHAVDDSSLSRVVLTFSMQGVGFITVPVVTVSLLSISDDLNLIWRLILGLGCLPGLVCMIIQWQMYRTKHRNLHEMLPTDVVHVIPHRNNQVVAAEHFSVNGGNNHQAADDDDRCEQHNEEARSAVQSSLMEDEPDGITREVHHDHHRGWWDSIRHEENILTKLFGTACTWFLFDVLFYGNTLFQPIVMEAAFGAKDKSIPINLLHETAIDSLILTSIALPGYFVSSMVLGNKTCGITQSPRYVMQQGFCAMAILYFAIGVTWTVLRRFPAFLILLYGLTFFFANYGPNTTTFVLPSLVYSPECRSTLNGISAASGKLGALVGATLFAPAADMFGDATVMMICSVMALAAFVMTNLFVQVRHE